MAAQHFQRTPELWFDDGTLVVQAEDSLFRVYKGLLSSRSSVFRDILSIPQPEAQETVDGCPYLHLSDSASDTKNFLLALHHSGFFEESKPTTVDIVAGVLRLSTKYDVDYLRHRAIRHLLLTYPMSLENWDKRSQTRTIPSLPGTPFVVLNIAREMDVPWILPAVLYCCCSHPIESIFDGIQWNGALVEMNTADKRRCMIASNQLMHNKIRTLYGFLRTVDVDGCRKPRTCEFKKLEYSATGIHLNAAALSNDFDWELFEEDVCPVCFSTARDEFDEARKDMWTHLPKILDLPSWTELEGTL